MQSNQGGRKCQSIKEVNTCTRGGNQKRIYCEHLDWLREAPSPDEIRLLTNAKVLTEGIDVPALDAVAFMRPRGSVVDVIQAVGRVMRKAPGKVYGYVVLPVVVRGEDEEREIEESGYRAVWQVLSALRSVDKCPPSLSLGFQELLGVFREKSAPL